MERFIYQYTKWGQFDAINFSDCDSQNQMTICPSWGAAMVALNLKGTKVIHTDDQFLTAYRFQSAVLSPFPNKIRRGNYCYKGKEYQLKKNDSLKQHAAHGLIYNRPFKVVSIRTSAHEALIELSYTYQADDPGYPFRFLLAVRYSLHRDRGLSINFTSKNISSSIIPYGIGYHPYFKVANNLNDSILQIPSCNLIQLGEDGIPTGTTAAYDKFAEGRCLNKVAFNNCFGVDPQLQKFEIALHSSTRKKEAFVWFEPGEVGFNYFQLYTHPTTNEIAIEPMSCPPDAFNSEEGLINLREGATVQHRFGIKVN